MRKPETMSLTPHEVARTIFGVCYGNVKVKDHNTKHRATKKLAQYVQLNKIDVLKAYGIRSDYELEILKEINKL